MEGCVSSKSCHSQSKSCLIHCPPTPPTPTLFAYPSPDTEGEVRGAPLRREPIRYKPTSFQAPDTTAATREPNRRLAMAIVWPTAVAKLLRDGSVVIASYQIAPARVQAWPPSRVATRQNA